MALKRSKGHGRSREGVVHGDEVPRALGCAIVTVSDTRRGADDRSGARIAALLEDAGHHILVRAWVLDEPDAIRRAVRAALRRRDIDLVATTGGTGIGPRDRTPEALALVVDAWLPGFGEHFRALSRDEIGAAAWLSRAGAGVARGRLVVMLPGSVAAVTLAVREVLLPELDHVSRLLQRHST